MDIYVYRLYGGIGGYASGTITLTYFPFGGTGTNVLGAELDLAGAPEERLPGL